MTATSEDPIPDPLENIKKLLGVVLDILLQFFTKVVPVLGIVFFVVLLLFYMLFKLFGLV